MKIDISNLANGLFWTETFWMSAALVQWHEVEQKYDAHKMKKVRANHICASYKQAIKQVIGVLKILRSFFKRKLHFIFNINNNCCSLFTPYKCYLIFCQTSFVSHLTVNVGYKIHYGNLLLRITCSINNHNKYITTKIQILYVSTKTTESVVTTHLNWFSKKMNCTTNFIIHCYLQHTIWVTWQYRTICCWIIV